MIDFQYRFLTPDTRREEVLVKVVNVLQGFDRIEDLSFSSEQLRTEFERTELKAYILEVKQQMVDEDVGLAIIFSPKESYVLLRYTGTKLDDISVSRPLETKVLLGGKAHYRVFLGGKVRCRVFVSTWGELQLAVKAWMRLLVRKWDAAIPMEYTDVFVSGAIGSIPEKAIISHG